MNKQMSSALAQGDNIPVILQGVSQENTLVAKEVEFLGDSLLVVKDETNNKIYTGVGYVCKGIGFSKGQKDRQLLNIQDDMVLNRGCLKFEAGVIDPNNEVLAIELDYLPIWLAKISITPKMKEQNPKLVERLVEYQLKAKDVLAKAFIHKEQANPYTGLSKELQAIFVIDHKQQEMNSRITKLENTMTIDYGQQKDIKALVAKKVISVLGGSDAPAYKNKTVSKKAFSQLHRWLRNVFEVNSYINIAVKDFERAKEIIPQWEPTEELQLMIKGANAQMRLGA